MTRRYRGGHLEDFVDGYVDGRLDNASTQRAARHLIACSSCRAAVEAERAIVARVRVVPLDPGRHARLVAGLVALEDEPARGPVGCVARPLGVTDRSGRVHVVAPDAPAHYDRSARRRAAASLVLAAACAGLVLTGLGHPRSTAPGRPDGSSQARSGDWIESPDIREHAAQVALHSQPSARVIEAWPSRSGRMAP